MKIIGGVKKYRTYLEGAIDAIATGASLLSPAGALISSMKMGLPSMPKLPQNMGFLLQAFVADLAEFNKNNPDKRLVLLFDEYHKISNEDIFNAMFDDIIENLPKTKNVLLVIASRKQMVEADVEPLKLFREYETATFLKENLGITDKKLIANAQRLLRGHPYSLGLLLRISKEKGVDIEDVIERLPETEVDDYLHKEFFDRLPENVQRFLRKVCVLQILDENVCKFVISSEDFDETACHNILNQLQKLMILDELGKIKTLRLYKLHDLFRDFLITMNETSLLELHLKAAEYYTNKIKKEQEDEGIVITDVRFALYHFHESREVNAFVELLNEYLEELLMLGYVIESLNYFNNINFEEISDTNLKSCAFHNYGNMLLLIGEYEEALDKFNQSLKIAEKLGDQRNIARTLHQIARIHQDKCDYEGALDKFNQSLQIFEKLGDKVGTAKTLHNVAIIHQDKGEYEEALNKYNRSLEIEEKLDDQRGIAQTLHQIANVHFSKGENDEALDKYNESLEIEKKLGDQRSMAYTQAQMGLLYTILNKKDKAIEYTQEALEIFEKIGLENDAKKAKAQIEKIRKSKS